MEPCERLKMAEERLAAGHWTQLDLRKSYLEAVPKDVNTAMILLRTKHYCLLGALCTDQEITESYISGERLRSLVRGELPGLKTALTYLGFDTGKRAYGWNDAVERKPEEVLDRVRKARANHCLKGQD